MDRRDFLRLAAVLPALAIAPVAAVPTLSEDSLEQVVIEINKLTHNRGPLLAIKPTKLITQALS